ncbi:ATP-dependent zinc protease family protein [Henriciella aquimarina]|uniref:ATP-dependent zinc protease family protein n=1 Tax=Henriciella aquimarina TaxID=545261 RepID=UPI0009FC1AA2|nr:RimK/LysX family protein [Henriciella aquimarina]
MMKQLFAAAGAALLCAAPAIADSDEGSDDKHMLGWLEFVRVADLDIKLDAKLDTGATTSSIHAEILSKPDRKKFDDEDADREIVFKIINEKGDERTIETDVVRWAAIKKKRGGVIYRPVVDLELCLGGLLIEDEVTLADRSHFNYETLIGRNMLKKANIIVDASDIYTKDAKCDS